LLMSRPPMVKRAFYSMVATIILTLVIIPSIDPRGYSWYWYVLLVPSAMFIAAAYLTWTGRPGGLALGMILSVVTAILMLLDVLGLTPVPQAPTAVKILSLLTTIIQIFVFRLCWSGYNEMKLMSV